MKTLSVFLLFLVLSGVSLAGDNSLHVAYPIEEGSYKTVLLENLQSLPDCTKANNTGMLYMNTATEDLELCANGDTVSYSEACFNRFWNEGDPAPTCPVGYANLGIDDTFTPTPAVGGAPGFTVHSMVCCSTGSVVGKG
jgi:hypothetical protein